jgi:DNA-binding MarR family transcriptional regulator
MSERWTPEGEAATEVILSTFRANGLLLAAGDVLAADEGLTSARWQVLGAVALAERPLTVPQIARRMGLTRQSVHATAKRLAADGLLEFLPNADHRRSQLVRPTDLGEAKYAAVSERQAVWANRLADGLAQSSLAATARTLETLCGRLEAAATEGGEAGRGSDRRGPEARGAVRARTPDEGRP